MVEVRTVRRNLSVAGLAFALLAVLAVDSRADMETYGFYSITNSIAGDVAIGEAQLFVDVSNTYTNDDPLPSNQVLFGFRNTGPLASSICDIYFDDGSLMSSLAMLIDADDNHILGGDDNVDFTQGASPGELPGASLAEPDFQTTAGFLADSDSPVYRKGVGINEWLGIVFNLLPGKTYTSVIDDLADGDLRIGIHVQGFDSGGSESFVNEPPRVPVPAAALLGCVGLSVAGWRLRRKKELA